MHSFSNLRVFTMTTVLSLVLLAGLFCTLVTAQTDQMLEAALKAADKAVGPTIAAAKSKGAIPTMRNIQEEAARRQKIADDQIVRAYNEFHSSPVRLQKIDQSTKEANFTRRFMDLFKPTLVVPNHYFFGSSTQNSKDDSTDQTQTQEEFSMFAPAPPPPSLHGKAPPAPGCLPPGEPRRIWAREQVMNVDAKHRSTPTMACAYECALRCSPCKDKPNPNLGRNTNIIFGSTSFIERSVTMQKVINDGNHNMAKCETECMPGCMKNPALAVLKEEHTTKSKSKTASSSAKGGNSFLEIESKVEAPKLTPKQTLMLRAHMAQKFQASGRSNNQLQSNSNKAQTKIVKPTYADQRGIDDGSSSSSMTAHRFQQARASLGGTTHNLATVHSQAGIHEGGQAGAGGPWWLNPPPWWLPPPPEWGSPPPSVYSPFYSPYSISQPQGANPGQNHAPAYSPTPLPYFFLQTGESKA